MKRRTMKFMNETLDKLKSLKYLLKSSDCVIIGAGAGLSTAAGIEYSGKRFKNNFDDFIKKYNFTDMYTAGFYNFNTEEEKWGYWAKHMYVNNIGMEPTNLYKKILDLVKDKEYFVITTNVDDQFYKTGFDINNIFTTQGSYKYIQCGKACHNKIYNATNLVKEMIKQTFDCKIPTRLIPKCPVCGKNMEVNIRKDSYFVQDNNWYKQEYRYKKFIDHSINKNVLLLELGVGFNTPGIIRFPFEKMTYQNPNWKLVRVNKDNCNTLIDLKNRGILIKDDINEIINIIASYT